MYFHVSLCTNLPCSRKNTPMAVSASQRIYLAIHLALEIIAPVLKAPITLPSGGHGRLQQQKLPHHAARPSD